eukprot:scaffold24589_cov113-Isochrysis_galbana.AAC.7
MHVPNGRRYDDVVYMGEAIEPLVSREQSRNPQPLARSLARCRCRLYCDILESPLNTHNAILIVCPTRDWVRAQRSDVRQTGGKPAASGGQQPAARMQRA